VYSKYYAWAVLFGLLAGLAVWYWQSRPPDTVIMQPAEVQDVGKLQKELDISKMEAVELKKQIAVVSSMPPVATYYVPAKTTQQAAAAIEKQIKEDKVPVELPPADKTIVTPQEQKVDVYRITLDKPRGIGIYASTESIGAMAQYKHITVFGGPKYDGGYEVGAGYMARW
jgi:hypothetical protein